MTAAIYQYDSKYFEQVASELIEAKTDDKKEEIYARIATIADESFIYLEKQFSLLVEDSSDFQRSYDNFLELEKIFPLEKKDTSEFKKVQEILFSIADLFSLRSPLKSLQSPLNTPDELLEWTLDTVNHDDPIKIKYAKRPEPYTPTKK